MHILVIGRSGQLACSLIQAAERARLMPGRQPIVLTALGRPDVDLTQPEPLAEVIARYAPDVVVNAAAYTSVDKAETEPEAAFALNAVGAGALARCTARANAALIHVSTDYVFDGTKAHAYVEDDPTAPLGVYGRSKLEGERLVAAGNPRHLIVRTAWVVSPNGNNFCKTMLRLATERDRLRVVDDQIGTPTYAPDLASVILDLAAAADGRLDDAPIWGVYHAANAGVASWADVAEAIMQEAARHGQRSVPVERIATSEFPTPARRPANSRLDTSKLRRTFGLALPEWRDGIARCVAALLEPN